MQEESANLREKMVALQNDYAMLQEDLASTKGNAKALQSELEHKTKLFNESEMSKAAAYAERDRTIMELENSRKLVEEMKEKITLTDSKLKQYEDERKEVGDPVERKKSWFKQRQHHYFSRGAFQVDMRIQALSSQNNNLEGNYSNQSSLIDALRQELHSTKIKLECMEIEKSTSLERSSCLESECSELRKRLEEAEKRFIYFRVIKSLLYSCKVALLS